MTFRKFLLAATMLTLPLAAEAQPVRGVYVGAAAGVNWLSDLSFNSTYAEGLGATFGESFNMRMSTGWAVIASLGWGFGNGLRVEGEVNYRNNDVDSGQYRFTASGSNGSLRPATGYVSTYGLMANLAYDIGATQGWPVHLTLGAGVGYAWANYDNVGGFDNAPVRFNQTPGNFAYQVIAGMGFPVRAVPGLTITAEYRYFATLDNDVRGSWTTGGVPGTLPQNARNVNNENQSVLLGVRYNFGQRPAAPPPPVVRPASSFIVFFDFNRSDLTARAREIVAQAAQAARTAQVTRIEVAGHTDTVGSAQYNLGLSQRRANTVAAELVRLGVPRQAISTAGYGFSRPLVPTGPNVREPQNRRVEIVFR